MAKDEDNEEILSCLAYEYQSMGKYEESIIYLKRLLLNKPKMNSLGTHLALCYELVDGYNKANKFH